MITKKILAMFILIVLVAIVIAILAMIAVLHDYEHTRCQCGNCKFYDKTLRTCWPKFEERFDGDKGCAFFENRDYEK